MAPAGEAPRTDLDEPTFSESQTRKPAWVWAVVLLVDLGATFAVVTMLLRPEPEGELSRGDGGRWIVIAGVLAVSTILVAFLAVARLDVEVYTDRVRVRWFPLADRTIVLSHVVGVEAVEYRPIWEYGGWGIRGSKRRRAYSMSGNRGVLLSLYDGSTVLIGTDDADRLAGAIRAESPGALR